MGAKAPIGLEIAATYQLFKRTGFAIAAAKATQRHSG